MEEWSEDDISFFRRLARLGELRRGGGPDQGTSLVHALLPEEVEEQDDEGDDE